eukprot:CAMPEP_0183577824 /NCGR_PEP_ID=MMETSP0371-20130417/140535_1 /TAXON_ID=268820 /ORGANISM="Peridinium aciculiferum, Strain PAER-2" /LENGTH=75 /DNA_ID=CAMNT_0025788193 /DNA_START=349 /DNA_END=572 /DNA_ORIENTATION=+
MLYLSVTGQYPHILVPFKAPNWQADSNSDSTKSLYIKKLNSNSTMDMPNGGSAWNFGTTSGLTKITKISSAPSRT